MVVLDGCRVHAEVWFDGACSGNPGPTGGGAIVVIGGARTVLSEHGGVGTNNEAEYLGLLVGLRHARERGADTVTVRGDSQLIIRQLEGRYQVKAPNLRPRYEEAKALLAGFTHVSLEWVPRAQNAAADQAARDALQ